MGGREVGTREGGRERGRKEAPGPAAGILDGGVTVWNKSALHMFWLIFKNGSLLVCVQYFSHEGQ